MRTIVIQQDFQTQFTDSGQTKFLAGRVDAIDLTDPTENNERTSEVEVGDPFNVRVDWHITGLDLPFVGGFWIVTLFSNHIDGVGTLQGKLATFVVPFHQSPPLNGVYTHTFNLPAPNATQQGVYQFTVTINHSTNGAANGMTEMIAFAESSPFQVVQTPVEVADQ